ncbi:CE295 protein, partial [Nothoprocta pentlandii]|nr:CE295 protein [Nothoprocta pentlandii]
ETESGRGIMEEPELTLTSSNDISIAESDTEHTSQEKAQDGKISNPACADQSEFSKFPEEREFLPLSPDTDYSVLKRPEGSFCAQSPDEGEFPSHQPAAMPLQFPSVPGTLQESFLKRKKDFIQKSQRRVEEIKSKERKNGTVEAEQLQRRKTAMLSRPKAASPTSEKGAATTRLKKVGEVQVSSPAARKAAAVEMSQRTSRLYNQLTEVKIRKEERTRQETYAKNREKAKEFQK